jgi:hypothetical protein
MPPNGYGLTQRPTQHPSHGLLANRCRATGHRRHNTRYETENGRMHSTDAPPFLTLGDANIVRFGFPCAVDQFCVA